MNVSPNCCAKCGYLLLIADQAANTPEDLKTAKKMAIRQKMHFESGQLTECPQCKYVFPDNGEAEHVTFGPKELEQQFAFIRSISGLIKSLRQAAKGYRRAAESLDATRLIDGIANTDAKINVTVALDDLLLSLEELRQAVNETADDVREEVTDYKERRSSSSTEMN